MTSGATFTSSGFNEVLQLSFTGSSTRHFSLFGIGTNSATPTTTNTGLSGTIANWDGSASTFKAYVTGYPTFDALNNKATLRAFISASEATGITIREYCDFNTNSPKAPAGRFVFADAITKTTSNQITIISVYKRT